MEAGKDTVDSNSNTTANEVESLVSISAVDAEACVPEITGLHEDQEGI